MNAAADQPEAAPEELAADEMDALIHMAGQAIGLAAQHNRRVLIGISGGPGSGKSTFADKLVGILNEAVPGSAAQVPMDGFHRPHAQLLEDGTVDAKGAPHTFDVHGFLQFLEKLRAAVGPVSGPVYSREIEDVVPDAFSIAANVPILIVEGNYLLLDTPPWNRVRRFLDFSAHLDVPKNIIRARLLRRHAEHGLFTEERNKAHVEAVDLPNYQLVAAAQGNADLIIRLQTET